MVFSLDKSLIHRRGAYPVPYLDITAAANTHVTLSGLLLPSRPVLDRCSDPNNGVTWMHSFCLASICARTVHAIEVGTGL